MPAPKKLTSTQEDDAPIDSLINFTTGQFNQLLDEEGLENTTRGVVEAAQEKLDVDFTYEGLRDGTAPLLDVLYSGLEPHERKLYSDEEILNLFTNVEDFGKYDTERGKGAKFEAFKSGALRAAPEAIAGGYGFTKGARLGMQAASIIPPIGLPGLIAKGAVILGGGLTGAILAAWGADEAEEAIIGEEDPVMPSLRGANIAGETFTYGLSMLHSPWMLTQNASKSATGAIEFLDNFKQVATGKLAGQLDDAIELTAKNAGMSNKAFKAAQIAGQKFAEKGLMFGGASGKNIGFTRFNKDGTLFDPIKGPLVARTIGAVEQGLSKTLRDAQRRKLRFLGIETAAAAGAAAGANVAENLDPGDTSTRLLFEVLGSAVVPFPVQFIVESAPDLVKNVAAKSTEYFAGRQQKDGILKGKIEKDVGQRIYRALQLSEEFQGDGLQKLDVFIEGLMKESVDADGNPVEFGGSAATFAQAMGLPFSNTVANIERELGNTSKELSVATKKGREQFQQGAKNAIMTLVNSGDSTAIQVAARLEQAVFEQNISDDIENSVSNLLNAANRVLKGPEKLSKEAREIIPDASDVQTSSQIDLGARLYTVLQSQLEKSKQRERQLWKDVGNIPITSFTAKNGRVMGRPNLLQILDRSAVRNGLKFLTKTKQSDFDSALGSGFMNDLKDFREYFDEGKGRNPITSGKLYELRSGLLDRISNLRATGKKQLANQLAKLEAAVLQDLVGGDVGDPAYNVARAYTFARNNVFTRSFLGKLQVKTKDGAFSLTPELLGKELFTGGMSKSAQRIDEINQAVKFGVDHGLTDIETNRLSTNESIDLLIRDTLRKIIDVKEEGGRQIVSINPTKLNTLKKEPGFEELLSVVPLLKVDLENAQTAKKLYDQTSSDILDLKKSNATLAFQNVLDFNVKPAKAVGEALKSDNPLASLQELVNLAKRKSVLGKISGEDIVDAEGKKIGVSFANKTFKGVDVDGNETDEVFNVDQALEGLRKAMLDNAVFHSGGAGLSFSPNRLFNHLFVRVPGVDPSLNFNLMDFMIKNDVINEDHANDLKKAIAQMRNVEEAFATGNLEQVLFKNPTTGKMVQARMIGATLGQRSQELLNRLLRKVGLGTEGGGMGGGIVAASAGSEAVINMLLKGPETTRVKLMTEIFQDRKRLGSLLKDIKTEKDAEDAFSSLATSLSVLARQTGRRLPYIRQIIDEDAPDTTEYGTPEPVIPVDRRTEAMRFGRGQRRQTPATTPTTPMQIPQVSNATRPALPPVAQASPPPTSPAQSDPQTRQKYAALFPDDPTSAMIRGSQGGIGSLFG